MGAWWREKRSSIEDRRESWRSLGRRHLLHHVTISDGMDDQMPVALVLTPTFLESLAIEAAPTVCRSSEYCSEACLSVLSPFIAVDRWKRRAKGWRVAQRNRHLHAYSGIVPTSRRRQGSAYCNLAFG